MIFDGETYDPHFDRERLTGQWRGVFDYMARPVADDWYTLDELHDALEYPQQSISARIRDFRKAKFGGHFVDRRRSGAPGSGCWEYRLAVRRPGPEQMDLL